MATHRFAYPACFIDAAFRECAAEAITEPELVANFERLYGVSIKGDGERAMRAFTEFVHDSIYMRLPDEAIEALRATPHTSFS